MSLLKKRLLFTTVTLFILATLFLTGYSSLKKEVTLDDDGKKSKVTTFTRNVEEFLKEQNLQLKKEDKIEPALDTPLKDNMTIKITRSFDVTVKVDNETKKVTTTPKTTEEILNEVGIKLEPLDIVEPDLDEKITSEKEIKITRVTQKTYLEKIKIPFETETKKDSGLPKGTRKVVQKGQEGIKNRNWLITYHDNEEIKRELTGESILREPVNRIIKIGTKETVSRGGYRINYNKALKVRATAYTHTGNKTYTNVMPKRGTIAVDPKVIPLGTRLYVEGYGYGVAQDVGGAIKGNRIDVFMETEKEARRWGSRYVKVYILE